MTLPLIKSMCEMVVKSRNAIVTLGEQIRPKPRLLTKQYDYSFVKS